MTRDTLPRQGGSWIPKLVCWFLIGALAAWYTPAVLKAHGGEYALCADCTSRKVVDP